MWAYYEALPEQFLAEAPTDVREKLMAGYAADQFSSLFIAQYDEWLAVIRDLNAALAESEWMGVVQRPHVVLEMWIPRRLSRADVVLLYGDTIAVLEFKRAGHALWEARRQVEDYCLELAHFHKPSHGRRIVPIAIAGSSASAVTAALHSDIECTRVTNRSGLGAVLREVFGSASLSNPIEPSTWVEGDYCPVPSLIEASQAMFAEMSVDDIARADADAQNLGATVTALKEIIRRARDEKKKIAAFVTGVPGAGKTLAGLKLVHDRNLRTHITGGVCWLSGNDPLVRVLQHALVRDKKARLKARIRVARRGGDNGTVAALREQFAGVHHEVTTGIQHVLGFKKDHFDNSPPEHVIVFDEAQRAWTAERNSRVLAKRAGVRCELSEPELFLTIMGRHEWAVVIALIGGGQEIHDGEAGLGEWGRALAGKFKDWEIACSPEVLTGGAGTGGHRLFSHEEDPGRIIQYQQLHLDNPLRQYRGKSISNWVDHVVTGDSSGARPYLLSAPEYDVVITRDLDAAREWLTSKAHGSQKTGLLASSTSARLRAYGIETDNSFQRGVRVAAWFLADRPDVRRSNHLEIALTEFKVQGLEVDWAGVCWGGDLAWDGGWTPRHLWQGKKWCAIPADSDKRRMERAYIINSYRVLLTRARLGMVIFVPPGNPADPTLRPEEFDAIYEFLRNAGTQPL
jgi:hypothetical protein